MGKIAPRKNTSPGFSLPGLDGLWEKWRRRFGPDDDVSRPAAKDHKRAPGQLPDTQDSLATASPLDASYALAIGSAADEDEPLPAPIGSAGAGGPSHRDAGAAADRHGAETGEEPFTTPLGSAGQRPDYLAEEAPRRVSSPAPPRSGMAQRGKTGLATLWHLPDGFKWMGPLPPLHRRWLLIVALMVAIVLLWPYSPQTPPASTVPNDAPPAPTMQAELVDNSAVAGSTDNRQVQTYRIADGQTLAQLFRAHNLPVADAFAMAQVEGSDKPLSSLQAGQEVRIVQNAQGVVTLLEIETGAAGPVRFSLQPYGSYQRR